MVCVHVCVCAWVCVCVRGVGVHEIKLRCSMQRKHIWPDFYKCVLFKIIIYIWEYCVLEIMYGNKIYLLQTRFLEQEQLSNLWTFLSCLPLKCICKVHLNEPNNGIFRFCLGSNVSTNREHYSCFQLFGVGQIICSDIRHKKDTNQWEQLPPN